MRETAGSAAAAAARSKKFRRGSFMVMPREFERLPRHTTIIFASGLNVCFWHKADIPTCSTNVCFRKCCSREREEGDTDSRPLVRRTIGQAADARHPVFEAPVV